MDERCGDWAQSRCHEAERTITQSLCAPFDVGWYEGVNLLPSFAAVGAALDVESLRVDADERPVIVSDYLSFGDGGGEISPRLAIKAGPWVFSAKPELAVHDTKRGPLRAGRMRAVPRFASIDTGPRVRGHRVGHDEQLAVTLHLAATGRGVETFRRKPFPSPAVIITGEKMTELRSRLATIVAQREETSARVAAIHSADVMRIQLASRIVFELAPKRKDGECLAKVRGGAKGHVAAGDEDALAAREAHGEARHQTRVALAIGQIRCPAREVPPV